MRVDDRRPVVVRQLVDEVVADDPGAGDGDVEPAGAFHGAGDRCLHVVATGDVAACGEPADLRRGALGLVTVVVGDHDECPTPGETACGRSSDPARATGDERRLSLEPHPGDPILSRVRQGGRLTPCP